MAIEINQRIELQPAYVLHTRAYQNTSLLLDALTYDFGRVTAVVKGIRRKNSRIGVGELKLFTPLLLSWSGSRELKTITHTEAAGSDIVLRGTQLFCGMYINELLTKLLQPYDTTVDIYEAYEALLMQIQHCADLELPLRQFERTLLDKLGYGIDFEYDNINGKKIVSDKYYAFHSDKGFVQIDIPQGNKIMPNIFLGQEIQVVAVQQEKSVLYKPAAKRLMRIAFDKHLGGHSLKSRQLFVRPRRTQLQPIK